MKFRSVIIIFAILTSCTGHNRMRALLDTADSLVDIRPDSALAMLDRHESVADSMPTGMQMRYRLLRAKAMNRLSCRSLPTP